MGGKKRTIEIKKIENKSWKTVAFSKRRTGLFSKSSKLCVLSGAKIAILMTPISSKSNVSFYSFGHSSVDSVVSAFLTNQLPRDDNNIEEAREELGFWWEDERFAKSENPKELSDAMDSISSLLQNLKGLQSEAMENRREREDLKKKKNVVSHGTHQEFDPNQTLKIETSSASKAGSPASFEGFIKKSKETDRIVAISDNNMNKDVVSHGTHQELDQNQNKTLIIQSSFTSICIQDGSPTNFEGSIKNSGEEDQIVAISDNNMNKDVVLHGTHQELDQNQTLNLQSCSASIGIQDGSPMSFEGLIKNSEEEDHIVAISDENNNNNVLLGNLDWCNKELGLDEIFDFETKNSEGISMDDVWTNQNPCSDSDEVIEDRTLMIHRDFDEDNQHLSDLDENQNITSSDNNNNNALHGDLDVYNQEPDEYFDFLMNCEDSSMNLEMDDISTNHNMCLDYEAIEDGVAMMIHKEFDEDNLHFSDYFSMKNFEGNGGIGSVSFG